MKKENVSIYLVKWHLFTITSNMNLSQVPLVYINISFHDCFKLNNLPIHIVRVCCNKSHVEPYLILKIFSEVIVFFYFA